MITVDGALWQKIRAPQQPAFHPNMFEEYFPYLMAAIRTKMARWAKLSETGETIEMVEETWTLAADMVCKALFDREMPFNPHFVFKQVKTYTDVMNHKSIRLKNVRGELEEITEEERGQGHGGVGLDPRHGDWRRRARASREDAAQDARGRRGRPELPRVRSPAGDRRDEAISVGRHRDHGADACLVALSARRCIPRRSSASAREARAVCGDREPDWQRGAALSYTRMVIQETMRLFPPIWALIRIAAGDDVIDGHKIKAGDKVVILTYIAHHSPKYWDEPEKFDPERFAPERAKKRVKYTYLPFAAGKRACIGGALSQIENTCLVASRTRWRCAAAAPLHAGICRAAAGEDPRHRDALPQRRPALQDPRAELVLA